MNAKSLNIVLVLVGLISLIAIKASLSEIIEYPSISWLDKRRPIIGNPKCLNNCRPICEAVRAKHNKVKSRVLSLFQLFGRSLEDMRSWRTKIVLVPLRLGDNHYDHERKCHFVQGPCRCRLNV